MVEIIINESSTHKAEDQFEKYHEAFGDIVEAEMLSNISKVEYELVLTNKANNKMRIKTGLTSGYNGTGPNGTYRVLKKAGFAIEEDFIHTHETFKLTK